jgi:two-component system CheB/CheR fusion protein
VDKEAAQRIQDLEQELQFTRENLQATIEELETSNEELQATNEELLASNEELQSTNEELQSVNEELHTVNTEHQRKIMELTELNNDIRNLMAGTGVETLFLDENLEVRKFTPRISRLFNLTDGDVGRRLSQVSHRLADIDLPRLIETVQHNDQRLEKEVQTTDGQWFLMRVMPYLIGTESFSGWVMTFIDIDALKKSQLSLRASENALSESESKFRLLAENIQDVFWMRTPDLSRTVYVSPAYEKIWGRSLQDIYADPRAFIQAIHPDDRGRVFEELGRHSQGVWDVEYRIQKPDRSVSWIHDRGFPITDDRGRLAMMCGFASDVTVRKTREEACLASVSRFKSTFEATGVGIALIDSRGQTLESNHRLQTMLGYSGAELRRMPFEALSRPEDRDAASAFNQAVAAGARDFYQLHKRLVRQDGTPLPVNLTLIALRDGSGNPGYAIALVEPSPGPQPDRPEPV